MAALAKLKIAAWPWRGPIGIVERNEFLDREDVHLIDAWRYLGTARSEADLHQLLRSPQRAPFDIDTYKLLKAQLKKKGNVVRKLERHGEQSEATQSNPA